MTDEVKRRRPVAVTGRPASSKKPTPVAAEYGRAVSDEDLARIDRLTDQTELARGTVVSSLEW